MNRREFSKFIALAGLSPSLLRAQLPTTSSPFPAQPNFSVMLWTLEKLAAFDRCLEIVAEAGYQGVELVGEFHKWSSDEMQRVMARMRSLHMRFDMISGVKSGFADPNGTSALLAELAEQFKTAKALESPQVNLKSGPRIDSISPTAQHEACVENLKRAADLAAANDVQIVIEPIDVLESPTMYMTSVSEGFAIARAVASPHVRVLYDFYHEQRGAGNLIEKLEQNIDLVALVHIADVPGRHEPGTGEIDYRNIYRKLAQLKYDKFITMEFYPSEDAVATLKKARIEAIEAMKSMTLSS
ncbi:TIM barrel protein [Acidicapsa dinghuensis]|uniref:TIM barrel protein n=1 Tax=Acidicapsa dinghuensis TaxID=2218256 RepID=A0ABW1EMJ3_9BACT|nr:TIM barrel protein [Acidicapsa dinghuensis]